MVCYVASTITGGWLADRWGRARSAATGNALSLVGCALALSTTDPDTAMLATWLVVGGAAMFFPGCAGLFSDAEAAAGAKPMALHVKLSGYNLGWSSGAFVGFGVALLIAARPLQVGYIVMTAAFLLAGSQMLRFWSLPPLPPAPVGDRSAHPAIPWLVVMYRLNVALGAGIGMSLIGMLDQVLREHVSGEAAVTVSRIVLSSYAASYLVMFVVLGRWSGWILRPWRMLVLQSGLIVGPLLLLWLATSQRHEPALLAIVGSLTGLGFGVAFTASLYYSLRSPDRASRAASLHEASVGCGNIVGPLIGSVAIWLCTAHLGADRLTGLAAGCCLMAALALVVQLLLIPRAVGAGAGRPYGA
ncbi:MAG: MFS transporter [Planctomycetes bacterium]|nr:MFS transporter [Planctomycetota bacterium]